MLGVTLLRPASATYGLRNPPEAAIPARAWRPHTWHYALLLLVGATILIRARYFGNPLIGVDEEFYLLAGDRLLHGAIPYVDIWDRKPVGLFLVYAAIRLLGGDGILEYQLVAACFVAATAAMIAIMARRIATPGAALVAGLAYVPALAMSGGQGGQSPVFYNLPVIVAAWLLLGLVAPARMLRPSATQIRWRGAAAMLLIGIALQIKYSVLFEGVFLGCTLLWLAWRNQPQPMPRAIDGLLWLALALAPTLLAWGWYIAMGQGRAFVFANFISIFARGAVSASHQWHDLKRILVRLLIFAVPIAAGEWPLRRVGRGWRALPAGRAAHGFLAGWLASALVGFAAFGTFFNHYALPLLPPLAILAAPSFAIAWRRAGLAIGALALIPLAIAYPLDAAKYERHRGDAAWAAREASIIAPRLHGRCLYVFYGEPIYYQLAHSCLPTRFAFPFHLSLAREGPALGIDPLVETRRILDAKPPVILDRLNDDDEINVPVQTLVRNELHRHYRLIWQQTNADPSDHDSDQIWERSLATPPRSGS